MIGRLLKPSANFTASKKVPQVADRLLMSDRIFVVQSGIVNASMIEKIEKASQCQFLLEIHRIAVVASM